MKKLCDICGAECKGVIMRGVCIPCQKKSRVSMGYEVTKGWSKWLKGKGKNQSWRD